MHVHERKIARASAREIERYVQVEKIAHAKEKKNKNIRKGMR